MTTLKQALDQALVHDHTKTGPGPSQGLFSRENHHKSSGMAMSFFYRGIWKLRLTKALCVVFVFCWHFFLLSSSCTEDSAFYRAFWYKSSHNSKLTSFFSCFEKLIKKSWHSTLPVVKNYHKALFFIFFPQKIFFLIALFHIQHIPSPRWVNGWVCLLYWTKWNSSPIETPLALLFTIPCHTNVVRR